jgi:hypothetical protein
MSYLLPLAMPSFPSQRRLGIISNASLDPKKFHLAMIAYSAMAARLYRRFQNSWHVIISSNAHLLCIVEALYLLETARNSNYEPEKKAKEDQIIRQRKANCLA